MTTLVIQHVKASELPKQWAQQLKTLPGQTVTVRIETEAQVSNDASTTFVTDDPAFGIWRDHDATQDVANFVSELRAPRYQVDSSRTDNSGKES